MRLTRPVAVLGSAVILTLGTVVVVQAATATHPIQLCSNNLSRVVQVPPRTGTCPRGTTTLSVASAADLTALAARVDAVEGALPKYVTVSKAWDIPRTSGDLIAYADCPDGFTATGGGYYFYNPDGHSGETAQDAEITGSFGTRVDAESLPNLEIHVPALSDETADGWGVALHVGSTGSGQIVMTVQCAGPQPSVS